MCKRGRAFLCRFHSVEKDRAGDDCSTIFLSSLVWTLAWLIWHAVNSVGIDFLAFFEPCSNPCVSGDGLDPWVYCFGGIFYEAWREGGCHRLRTNGKRGEKKSGSRLISFCGNSLSSFIFLNSAVSWFSPRNTRTIKPSFVQLHQNFHELSSSSTTEREQKMILNASPVLYSNHL